MTYLNQPVFSKKNISHATLRSQLVHVVRLIGWFQRQLIHTDLGLDIVRLIVQITCDFLRFKIGFNFPELFTAPSVPTDCAKMETGYIFIFKSHDTWLDMQINDNRWKVWFH